MTDEASLEDFQEESISDEERYAPPTPLDLVEGEVHKPAEFDQLTKLGPTIFLDWQEYFTNVAINHEHYAAGAFHLVFGQLEQIRKIRIMSRNGKYLDPRIHLTLLSPSGSGKGEGQEFIERMAEHLGLKVKNVSRTTEAGVTGTIKENDEFEVITTSGYLDPNSGVNIIASSEASNIIKNVERDIAAQDMLNTLQIVMDTMGTHKNLFTKKLKENEEISYHPVCSLYLTSVYKGYMGSLILKGGFFQRMYLVIKQLGIKERRAEDAELDEREANGRSMQEEEEPLAKRMLAIDQAYRDVHEMYVTPEAYAVFRQYRNETYDLIEKLRPTIQEDLISFVGRFRDLLSKIAMHFACLNLHRHIERGDAETAVHYTRQLLTSLIMYLHDESEAVPNKTAERAVKRKVERVEECIEQIQLKDPTKYGKSNGFVEVVVLKAKLALKYRLPDQLVERHLHQIWSWGLGEYKELKSGVKCFRLKPDIDINALISDDEPPAKKE